MYSRCSVYKDDLKYTLQYGAPCNEHDSVNAGLMTLFDHELTLCIPFVVYLSRPNASRRGKGRADGIFSP